MNLSNIWQVLAIIAAISLVISFFMGRNAIWGMLTLGIVIAVVVSFIFKNNGFNWLLFKKVIIVAVLVGVASELLGRLSNLIKSKSNS